MKPQENGPIRVDGGPPEIKRAQAIATTSTPGETHATTAVAAAITLEDQDATASTPTSALAVGDTSAPAPAPFDALHALTGLLIGLGLEGVEELIERLQQYEAEIQAAAEGEPADTSVKIETAEDRLRFALVGFLFDTQARVRRGVSLGARALDVMLGISTKATRPITHSRLGRPFQRRYDRLVNLGEETLARWVDLGRDEEPATRELARRTYNNIVDEFIERLADNPEVQQLVQQQSIGLASEIRDEVRERTVTADNVVEDIVRRILRRPSRGELPEPPPEVSQWAGKSLHDYEKKRGT